MSYVNKILLHDERVLCITTIHGIIYAQGLLIVIAAGFLGLCAPYLAVMVAGPDAAAPVAHVLGGIAFLAALIGAILLIFAYIRQVATELAVTNRRVIAKYGVIARMTYEIMIDRITGANFEQPPLGRILGYGTVIVHGAGGDISPFERIGNPEGFHRALMQMLERGQVMTKR